MRLILRCGFVLLLLLGLGERVLWYQTGKGNRDPNAALASRMTSIGLTNFGQDRSGLFEAAAPGCPTLFPVGLAALDGSEDARFDALLHATGHPLFIYMNQVAPRRDSRHVVTAWFVTNAKAMLGLRRDQAPNKLVLVVLPASCPGLTALNWQALSQ